jgi:hypothetical protein
VRRPTRAGLELPVQQEHWINAAIAANNLSELQLNLGMLDAAVTDGQQSVQYADKSGDAFWKMGSLASVADALQQLQRPGRGADPGDPEQARRLFERAEELQRHLQPQYPRLYSLRGFRYCDLLLSPVEQAAYRCLLSDVGVSQQTLLHMEVLAEAEERAEYALAISTRNNWLM